MARGVKKGAEGKEAKSRKAQPMKSIKESFIKSIKAPLNKTFDDLHDRTGLRRAGMFVAVFAIAFFVCLFAILPLTEGFWGWVGTLHAGAANWVLSAFGFQSSVFGNAITMQVQGESVDFAISHLCAGDIEIALMACLLIASLDVLLVWRLAGILIGAVFLTAMNPLRIAVTLMITQGSGLEAGDFYHGLVFRLFLLVLLIFYYFAWYRAFARRAAPRAIWPGFPIRCPKKRD